MKDNTKRMAAFVVSLTVSMLLYTIFLIAANEGNSEDDPKCTQCGIACSDFGSEYGKKYYGCEKCGNIYTVPER